jgi:NADH dehydrogenase FAD-containing subunit
MSTNDIINSIYHIKEKDRIVVIGGGPTSIEFISEIATNSTFENCEKIIITESSVFLKR